MAMSAVAEGSAPKPRAHKSQARQRRILDKVVEEGSCSAHELSRLFNVSIMTVHRDLDELERRGVVRKFHGGVTALPSAVFEAQMSWRMAVNQESKQRIAAAALERVEAGTVVLLDDSSTALHMVPGLTAHAPLHVATTCMAALRQLSQLGEEGLRVIGLGGDYDSMHDSFVGMACVEQIQQIRADSFFMSTSAVFGLDAFHQEERIVAVKRAMMRVSTRSYLLVDASKFGRVALHRLAPLSSFDMVFCDSQTPPEMLDELSNADIPFQVV